MSKRFRWGRRHTGKATLLSDSTSTSMPMWRALRYVVPTSPRRSFYSIFWTLAPIIGFNDYIAEVTSVNGRSMSPTLSPDFHETGRRDFMIWSKWQPTKELKRGDIIMYDSPKDPESCAVKRVIALAGDTVVLDRRRRPGRDDEGEVNENEIVAKRNWDALGGKVTVPFGHIWVEGDNWRKSFDSNHVGPISKSLIVAKAVCIIAPWERMGTKPWERLYAGRTKVLKGREDVPEQWQDLVGISPTP